MEKKSTWRANAAALSAAAGTSTIMPTCSPAGRPRPARAIASSRSPRAVNNSSSVVIIGNITLTGVCCGQPHHRQQLVGQQFGMGQRQPDAANPEVRVHLGRCGQELQRLVTADVERAQRNSPPVKRFGDLAIDGELLLDVRRVLAAEEQELGAHQAGEIRAMGGGRPRVVDRADVGADRHRDAVAGDRRLGSARLASR